MNVEILSDRDWADALDGEWQSLFADAPTATPFQSPEWLTTWWEVYGGWRRPHIVALKEGRDLVGLFPMLASTGAWRTLRPMGIRGSDYLHPLMRRGYEREVLGHVADHLSNSADFDLVDLHHLRETFDIPVSRGLRIEQATCLVLNLPTTYDAYLATLSKSLRFDCRRLDKKPFVTGEAKVEQVATADVPQAVDDFFELHHLRWRRRGQPGAFALKSARRFLAIAAERLAGAGHLRLTSLSSQEQRVGLLFGMHAGQTTYFYQCGFDPAHKALSPGTLLVAAAIREAISEGAAKFDFLRGDEPYKRRWKPQDEYRNLRRILALNPIRGEIGKTINDATGRLEAKIRARLEGKGILS